jgi:hypothetical protein
MRRDSNDQLDEGLEKVLKSSQPFATVVLDYAICSHCRHVHRRHEDTCPACKGETRIARVYAPLAVYTLINLMQDYFRMELRRTTATGETIIEQKGAHHGIGIVLLFCTLVECWMDYFLSSLMVSRNVSSPIMDRLLSDNWRLSDRKGKLFKTLTNEPFGAVIQELTDKNKKAGGDLDYGAVWAFAQGVSKKRNAIIHEGAIHAFPESVVWRCLENIDGVNQLFISLHNRYVAHDYARLDPQKGEEAR